ncbi:hypothetical protein [Flavobacterium sp.]|uniref:hypothetical protein n=1 Tax=Flavobacterium sp. TaxID=239 RepID=UPI003919F2DE
MSLICPSASAFLKIIVIKKYRNTKAKQVNSATATIRFELPGKKIRSEINAVNQNINKILNVGWNVCTTSISLLFGVILPSNTQNIEVRLADEIILNHSFSMVPTKYFVVECAVLLKLPSLVFSFNTSKIVAISRSDL